MTSPARVLIVFTVLAFFGLAGAHGQALTPGAIAPNFELPAPGGLTAQLSQERGKVVYVDFWASWCGPCRLSFPWMNEMHAKYGSQGLEIIAINVDANPADAKKFLDATPAKFRIAFDQKGATPKAYGVKAMPTSYLVDRQGALLAVHAGFSATKAGELEAEIKKALAQK